MATESEGLVNQEEDDGLLEEEAPVIANQPCHEKRAGMICLIAFLVVGGGLIGGGIAFWFARGSILKYDTTVVLISIDGFRAEYLKRGLTPEISALGLTGVAAPYMIPSFPSKTFPNHYTIVTGLYPESHGIVANTFFDPIFNATFSISDTEATGDARWWGGEPIWNTVIKAGGKAACYYWPGSEAPIQGIRPTYYEKYDHDMANENRVEQVIKWLQLPYRSRPAFITLYLSIVDDAGHTFGTDDPNLDAALVAVDLTIGSLVSELDTKGLRPKVDLIIVSDHGMTTISKDRVRLLDRYISLTDVDIIEWSPITAIIPKPGVNESDIFNAIATNQSTSNFQVFWKNSPNVSDHAPARFHFENNIRITPISVLMDLGWSMTDQRSFDLNPDRNDGGAHGYDNALPDMQAIFIANGPHFKQGVEIDPFPNVEVYNLLARIMKLTPAQNNGTANSQLINQALL